MANGFFLGGVAQGMNAYAERGLRERALGLQERQQAFTEQSDLMDRADKAIGDTMTMIGSTIKGIAAHPDIGTGPGAWAEAISNIESGGNYSATGPVTKDGDRAYGKYQVMGANIPEWTEEVLGRRLTPEQFLASPQIQDAVFAAKFGQYVDETGSADLAALKWFTGSADPSALALSDANGTTGAEYIQRFAETMSSIPRAKVKAAVAPLLNDVQAIAAKVGKNPQTYVNMVDAAIASTPFGFDAALAEGEKNAKIKIGERNALIRAGVAKAEADATAGIQTASPEAGLDPNQIVSAESTMRNQYTNLAKDFVTVRDAYGRVQQSNTGTAAGDLALIFNYMKMLDPGSTVREGEFANAQNATGVPGQVANLYNQLLSGTRLNGEQRKDFVNLAGKLYDASLKQHTALADQFTGIAKRTGLNPANVVVDLSSTSQPPGASAGATTAAPPAVQSVIGSDAPPDAFLPGDPDRAAIWKSMPSESRILWAQ